MKLAKREREQESARAGEYRREEKEDCALTVSNASSRNEKGGWSLTCAVGRGRGGGGDRFPPRFFRTIKRKEETQHRAALRHELHQAEEKRKKLRYDFQAAFTGKEGGKREELRVAPLTPKLGKKGLKGVAASGEIRIPRKASFHGKAKKKTW